MQTPLRRLATRASRTAAMPPLPVALCGKNPNLASHFVKLMNEGGDFEVVTVFNTTSHATTELPSLLSQFNPIKPLAGLGSNNSSASPIAPKAIIVGAGFSLDEMNTMRQAIFGAPGADDLAWFTPAKGQPQRPGEPGFMESVVGRAREALTAWRESEGGGEGGVFGF